MNCWHFYLHSFDTISTDKAHLSVFLSSRKRRFAELQPDKPLDLRLNVRVLCIKLDVCDVQASQRVAGGICASVNTLYFLEGNVALRCLFHQRSIITWSLHRMRDIWRISQLVAGAYRIKESNSLIGRSTNKKLYLLKITDVYNWGIMRIKTLVNRNDPRWVCLEQLYHVSLDVPNNDFRLKVTVLFTICMSLIHWLSTLLEFMWERNRRIFYFWHASLAWLIRSLIQVFLTWNQTAALCHIANGWWVRVSVAP